MMECFKSKNHFSQGMFRMKYYSSLLEKLLFDGYFLSQRIVAGITTACYIKSIAPVRVNEKKSELVMADRWYRCCFTKAYFMHTVSEISLVNQSRKRDRKRESGSRRKLFYRSTMSKSRERNLEIFKRRQGKRGRTDRRFLYG